MHNFSSLSKRLPQVLKIKRGCDKNDKSGGNSIKMTNLVITGHLTECGHVLEFSWTVLLSWVDGKAYNS